MSTSPSDQGAAAANGDVESDSSDDTPPAASKNMRGQRAPRPSAKDLLEKAVVLHTLLRAACARSVALVATLKVDQRQSRLLLATIASLNQLQHVGRA